MKKKKNVFKSVVWWLTKPAKWRETIETLAEKEIKLGVVIFVFVCLVVFSSTFLMGRTYDRSHLYNILVEAHGLVFDIFVFGIIVMIFNKFAERRRNILRWIEEIDDYKGWDEKEAMYRIVGNIKRLNREKVTRINLHDCFLEKANLSGLNLQKTHFENAHLDFANLRFASLMKANLEGAHLKGAHLVGANLEKANLWEVDFMGAELFAANLVGAHLSGARLKGACLAVTNLAGTVFWRADLEGVDLGSAHLVGADLFEANLGRVNFDRANLDRVNLEGANLTGAKNLTLNQLSKVETLYKAKLDPELLAEVKQKYPHLLENHKPEKK
ncbi:MAG: pentapeptide repeat-containing protein [Candidatus Aminicenantes bacterium]|nr:pentapeptide repeat-containing protein [Candidatus Aminicenantes bacterium]